MTKPVVSRVLAFLAIWGLMCAAGVSSRAQEKAQAPAPPSSCSRENALAIIQQQIDLARTFDNDLRRIAVLLRAADLIWPYQQEKARATFVDAFDVATRNFKAEGDKPRNEGRVTVGVPDQRFTVISAIAKRDPVWAGKLSRRILQEDAKEADDKAAKDTEQDARTGEKLLVTALSLIPSDQATALAFAKGSLAYTATIYLPFFLYKLTEVDRIAADQFYQEALTAYAQAPMEQFLYLSSYPFASNREIGEMPLWTQYAVPKSVTPNPRLQRLFVQTLLTRAQELLQKPAASAAGERFSEASQIWMALTRLEPQVAASLSDLSPALQELKVNIYALLSQEDQRRVNDTLADPPKKSFEEQVEAADRLANHDLRESGIAIAILNGSGTESLDRLESAAAKIDDLSLRSQLLSTVYFNRAQQAIKDKKFEEARRLAAKVDEPDLRAYLYSQIASESIKRTKNDVQAREMLEDVLDTAAKAPNTEAKARALLAVAYLYGSIDPNRSVAILGDAVKCINRLEGADLSHDSIGKKIEGKGFGFYTTLQMPGSGPETSFREIGKVDFDGVLYLASNMTDKSLRALTTLALVEQCLKSQPSLPKPKQSKPVTEKP